MWLHHFFNLLASAASIFVDAIGTTFLGLWLGIAFALATTLATLWRIRRKHGVDAMMKHWEENAKIALRVSLFCAAAIYIPVIVWSIGRAVYNDHEYFVGIAKDQRERIAKDTADLRDNKNSLDAQISELRARCAGLEGANGALSNQNRQQQNSINTCLLQQKEAPIVRQFMDIGWDKPQYGKMAYVLTTSTLRTPADIVVTCDFPIAEVEHSFLSETGGGNESHADRPISANQVEIGTTSPAWSPIIPMGVAVFMYKPINRMPTCTFVAK
jgi:hypothetical protein